MKRNRKNSSIHMHNTYQTNKRCTLNFNGTGVSDISAIGTGLGKLGTPLKELALFCRDTGVSDLTALGFGLGHLPELSLCTLDFSRTGVVNLTPLGAGLCRLILC